MNAYSLGAKIRSRSRLVSSGIVDLLVTDSPAASALFLREKKGSIATCGHTSSPLFVLSAKERKLRVSALQMVI
jgi:hypothetical protein